MSKLVAPHGGKGLVCCKPTDYELKAEIKKAKHLNKIEISSQVKGDLIMLGIGGFSPLTGFMNKADWRSVCSDFLLTDGTFWPIPIMLDADAADAEKIHTGDTIALQYNGEIYATMQIEDKFAMSASDKKWECEKVYKGQGEESADHRFWEIAPEEHPGVQAVMARKEFCLSGAVKVISEGEFPAKFKSVYLTPKETRVIFEEKGWVNIAAMQLRNPMHRSHEHLCKIALDVCDGVLIHSLIGNLKPGDIPAEVRIECIERLIQDYFVPEYVVNGGYPLDMRYAGPREGLLHATFRQNYGVNKMIIGRDHAGVGDFYTLFEAQEIFDTIPRPAEAGKALMCEALKIDWSFYCRKCDGMASMKTCPHGKEDRVILSGTKLRHALSNNEDIPDHFGRTEVIEILRKYYSSLDGQVEVKMQSHAEGSKM